MATARQIEVYNHIKKVCLALGHPQMTFYHLPLQGSFVTDGTTGNKTYQETGAEAEFNLSAGVLLWVVSTPQQMPVRSMSVADTSAGEEWITREMAECPVIDDSQNYINMLENDLFLPSSTNPLGAAAAYLRCENPVLSKDESWWLFTLRTQR